LVSQSNPVKAIVVLLFGGLNEIEKLNKQISKPRSNYSFDEFNHK